MVLILRNVTPKEFPSIWQSKQIGKIAFTFLSDVFAHVAVAIGILNSLLFQVEPLK